MTGVRYFALRRLPIYDLDGEPLTVEAGDLLPDELVASWGDVGVSTALEGNKIAPLPGWLADLAQKPRRAKAAA